MKRFHLTLFTGAALASYYLVKHRKNIQQEVIDTGQLVSAAKDQFNTIKHQIQLIQEQTDNLQEIEKDLSYQFKVFEQEVAARFKDIQTIWKKS